MGDCECRTVKFYDDKAEWRCMMCYRQFEPNDTRSARLICDTGVWVFQPFAVEKHGTG